ncbi:bone morphogenetic protein 4-like [Babylonia areolata]|uniref:bone morphogenetic protein 4-like n=1 Tax=Babylonia areolata TaxID=304850 RepID=UPI003FD61F56
MPASHPSEFLTATGKGRHVDSDASASMRRSPMAIDTVREEEVMYHLYKNGPLGVSYQRRASTVFLVELFNDLIQGRQGQPQTHSPPGNTIRSFSAREVTFSPGQKTMVHFTLPFLPPKERLHSAELRFLRHSRSARTRSKTSYKLSLAVFRRGRVVQRVVLRERALLQREYQVFDVSRVLEQWINAYHGNVTLQVRLPRRLERSLQQGNASLVSTSFIALYLQDRHFLRNMYQSYTTDVVQVHNNHVPGNSQGGAETGSQSSHHESQYRPKRDSPSAPRDRRGLDRRKSRTRKNKRWYRAPKHSKCRLYNFSVDFNFIGWGQWIIHPKDFNSKFCYGACPSPVDSKYTPTNHAMLQTLMRQKKRRLAPPTCCVPTRLKPLSMLYFEYGEIVVRHHEDMIADECGCR